MTRTKMENKVTYGQFEVHRRRDGGVSQMKKKVAIAKLKAQIKAVHGTEKAFAAAMGWQRQKVSYLVNGHYVTNVREINRIAPALKMDMGELLDLLLTIDAETAGRTK